MQKGDSLETYAWSSLPSYIQTLKKRPIWLETAMAFSVSGCRDTASGRRDFLKMLEQRVDWDKPGQAGARYSEGEGKPKLAVHSA